MCLCGYCRMEWGAFGEQWTVFKVSYLNLQPYYGTTTVLIAPALLTSNLYLVPFAEVRITPDEVSNPTLVSPTTFNFAVGIVLPTPTLLLASTVSAFAFANLDRSRARVIIPFLFIYL